jgi:IS5 family transposase
MPQPGLFDLDERYERLTRLGDPLVHVHKGVDWEAFRPRLERLRDKPRKSNAGRKPYDAVLMFKVLILQHRYHVSDESIEYQIRDRYSFSRFLGLLPEDRVPDATTVWLFREALVKENAGEELFRAFNQQLERQGFLARKGQIIDASIVSAPKQRNSREDNDALKRGEPPEAWNDKPAKLRQKDTEARWTKKHGKSYYGYKNHLSVDAAHKLVRKYEVTDAAVHDSQVFEPLLDGANTGSLVWADSAYRSEETERLLREKGLKSRIHHRGHRHKPLSAYQQEVNRRRSSIRVRVEHVFGSQHNEQGGKLLRTIGLVRAKANIGLMNLVYHMRRLSYLIRSSGKGPTPAPA